MSNLPETERHEADSLLAAYVAVLTAKMLPMARAGFEAEARAHLLEHAKAFEVLGDEPADAMRHAIEQFGDPKSLERALSTLPWQRPLWLLAALFDPYIALPVMSRRILWVGLSCWAIFAAAALISRAAPHSFGELFWPDERAFRNFSGLSLALAFLAGVGAELTASRAAHRSPIDKHVWWTLAMVLPSMCFLEAMFLAGWGTAQVADLVMLPEGLVICAMISRMASWSSFSALRSSAHPKVPTVDTQPNKPWIF